MKKLIPILSIAAIIASSTIAFAEYDPNKVIDNNLVSTKNVMENNNMSVEVKNAITINNKTISKPSHNNENIIMVPVREVAEELGFGVNWIAETNTITLTKEAVYVTFNVNEDGYTIARTAPIRLGSAPKLINGSTYVPVELFRDLLEFNVDIDEYENVSIYNESNENESSKYNAEIVSIDKDEVLVNDIEKGEVRLNINDDTVIVDKDNNKLTVEDLQIGSKLLVEYSEAMTKSIPPLNNPLKITLISNEIQYNAEIVSIDKDEVLVNDIEKGEVRLNISDNTVIVDEDNNKLTIDDLQNGNKLLVEYSEAMTKSIPPLNNPLKITLISAENKIQYNAEIVSIDKDKESDSVEILVNDTEKGEVRLNISDDTVIVDQNNKKLTVNDLKKGNKLLVEYSEAMTMSLPPLNNPSKITLIYEIVECY